MQKQKTATKLFYARFEKLELRSVMYFIICNLSFASCPCAIIEPTMNDSAIFTIGAAAPGGVYLLRIHVAANLQVRFGRFNGGKPVTLIAGEYGYLGSALARGQTPRLGQRVVRHTTRTGAQPPHAIRPVLLAHLEMLGMETGRLLPRQAKKTFWHIDYLLDCLEAEIVGVYLIPTSEALESALAGFLEAQPETEIVAKGLGASDATGHTHLLRVNAAEDWWVESTKRFHKQVA
jgi:Uri superfamily endonuclease